MNILIFFIILFILVIFHEFGHFFSAKKFGIRVDEFGFGFPPKIFGKKYGETEYTLNALPFGGFVKIFGENPDEESISGADSKRSFVNKPYWQQAIVLVAGIFANFLLAWILFSIVFMMGSPLATDSIPKQAREKMTGHIVVLGVLKNGPAYNAGIREGDSVVSISSKKETLTEANIEKFVSFSNKPKENLTLVFTRKGEEKKVEIIPEMNKDLGRAFIGISPGILVSGKFGFFESFKYGLQTTLLSSKDTIKAFGKLFMGGEQAKEVTNSIVGPVGLVKVTGVVNDIGFGYLISFMAVISISLAVINIVPFPALDGGRLLFVLIEKIKGSKINPNISNTVNMIGFFILIALMLLVTYHDVVKLL